MRYRAEQNGSETKRRWPRRLLVGSAGVLLLVAAAVLASLLAIDYLVDIWWFDALGYGFYYWQRVLYRYAVFALVSIFFFLLFFLNFWVAARYLKRRPVGPDGLDRTRRRKVFQQFQSGSLWFYAPLSLVLAIPIALPLFRQWERFLFYIFGRSMGVSDPYLGQDVSYYLFSLPIYTLIERRLLLALLVLTLGLCVLYMVKNSLLKRPLLQFGRFAKWHLSFLVLALFGIVIWEFLLQRYAILYDTSHQDLFHGPGYVQMNVVVPLIWACMAALAATALAAVVLIQLDRGTKTFGALALVFAVALVLRYTEFIPQLVQRYVVKPNEIEKEGPYIANHIESTLAAYKLTDLKTRRHIDNPPSGVLQSGRLEDTLRNIPVWDQETLAQVYQQLQELRTYYIFPQVSVGRYRIKGKQQQVFLSPREIEFGNLPGGARNWISEHMIYTHGFGVVMSPASQTSGEEMTWYLHNIPPESKYGLSIEQPRIYYGLGAYDYSIAPNQVGEMDYPKGETNVTFDYDGRGGVPISSLFRKLLFAYYLKNRDLFFTTEISDQSRLLLRRNIRQRIAHLAPYLRLDNNAYVVITEKGIYWIVDAYTTSVDYPAAAPAILGGNKLNYIRNSVKIVVDAYHGSVDFYRYDPRDPIAAAYARIYPGLFRDKGEMPEALRAHIRYPIDFFDIQMQVYAKYHQQDPQVFYQQEDPWTSAESLGRTSILPRQPYYVTLDLIEGGGLDFMLLVPMFPKNRDNLRALAIVDSNPDNYGEIIVYNFPKGELVYGPAQVDALINQDPDISRQFSLWDQAGSQVVRGKMIILPVGRRVLFVQPVYLKATSRVTIPELQRIIVSQDGVVVMAKSVQEAYRKLQQRIGAREPEPAAPSQEPPVQSEKPAASSEKPAASSEKPPASNEKPPASSEKPPRPNEGLDAAPPAQQGVNTSKPSAPDHPGS